MVDRRRGDVDEQAFLAVNPLDVANQCCRGSALGLDADLVHRLDQQIDEAIDQRRLAPQEV